LNSLVNYTNVISYEIIVVDNNSDEGNVQTITAKYKDVILIENEKNVGFARANNIGIEQARGKYFLMLNNDTIFYDNTLKKIFDFSELQGVELFVGCKLLNSNGTHQISVVDFDNILNSFGENFFLYKLFPRSKIFNRYNINYKKLNNPVEVDVIKGAFMFCSSSAIKKLKGFDPRFFFYGEETDICYRFKTQGGKIFYYPNTSIFHVGGATVDSYPWFKFRNQNISKIKKYQKHYNSIGFFLLITFHYSGLLLRIPFYFIEGIVRMNKKFIIQSYYYLKLLFIYPKNEFK
jgi:GT2 family glycosyltransferase